MTAARTRTGPIDLTVEAPAVHDHVTASGHGPLGFVETVARVLDRAHPSDLVVVSGRLDSSTPQGTRVLREGFDRGCLMLLTPVETYGPLDGAATRAAVADTRDAFDRVVDQALADGHRTVRIVADNTARLADATPERRHRWFEWEHATDAWQAVRPVSGVCWFDHDRVRPEDLRAGAHLHARSSGVDVTWRVFHRADPDRPGDTRLSVAGDVDAGDVGAFDAALRGAARALAPGVRRAGSSLAVDLADVGYLHHRALDALEDLAPADGAVTLHRTPTTVRRVVDAVAWWPRLALA